MNQQLTEALNKCKRVSGKQLSEHLVVALDQASQLCSDSSKISAATKEKLQAQNIFYAAFLSDHLADRLTLNDSALAQAQADIYEHCALVNSDL